MNVMSVFLKSVIDNKKMTDEPGEKEGRVLLTLIVTTLG
jgi:hypothetical protein